MFTNKENFQSVKSRINKTHKQKNLIESNRLIPIIEVYIPIKDPVLDLRG